MPQVIASTSIIADVAGVIGEGVLEVESLLSPGVDPHSYQPTPQDLAELASADLVLVNGFGLEEFLDTILEDDIITGQLLVVSEGIHVHDDDPHVWLDPSNVKYWVENISNALKTLAPDRSDLIDANTSAYLAELDELDSWINEQVSQIPSNQRILISDHLSLGYFAERYGFQIPGSITHSHSSLAETSAHDLADLVELIEHLGVTAIFVGHETNPDLAHNLSHDLEIELVELHVGSLSPAVGEAHTYLELMRSNVLAIVDALK